jgi:hypothetical protein
LLLRGVDRQIGLTERINAALVDTRHASYITHSQRDLLTQRIYQIGCGYEDGNDSNCLRHDLMFKLGGSFAIRPGHGAGVGRDDVTV